MDVAAIVFDMDGVLIDSESVWEDVRRTLVRERGGLWQPNSQHRMMGMSTREWARYLTGEVGLPMTPDEAAAEVIDRMVERFSVAPPLLPGAVDAVRRLARRWPLGLASSSPRRLIDVVLDRAALGGCFAVTLSTEEVERGKPAPDVYLEAARRLDSAPERCVAIEDSTNGLRSAHATGMRVIAIPRPDFPPEPEALALAVAVPSSIEELTEAVVTAAARAV